MGANPFVLVFTTLYVFAYRDVIRRSAEWGAFQISVKGLVVRKLLTYSLPLLVALPLLTFIPFKNIVGRMEIHSVNLSHLVWELFISSLIVCTLGLFPRAGQYLWVIIARHKLDKGRGAGEVGEGWLYESISPYDDVLPNLSYAWQATVVCGVIPIGILIYHWKELLIVRADDLTFLCVTVYVAQLIVFFYRAKELNYFYPTPNPRFLWSKRMWLTVPVTILLPISFSELTLPWLLWVTEHSHLAWIVLVAVALFFPFYCYQTMLIVAKRRQWVSREANPELHKGSWIWSGCAIIGSLYIACFIAITTLKWNIYIPYLSRIFATVGKR